MFCKSYLVFVVYAGFEYFRFIKKGSVCAVQIFEKISVTLLKYFGVMTGYGRIINRDIIIFLSSDGNYVFVNRHFLNYSSSKLNNNFRHKPSLSYYTSKKVFYLIFHNRNPFFDIYNNYRDVIPATGIVCH